MNIEEARQWLRGERSMTNIVPYDPMDWQSRIAVADAAMVQQAYWVAKAYSEGLIMDEEVPK